MTLATPFTLTGGGQTYGSSIQPLYDTVFRFWRCQDANGDAFNVVDPTGTIFIVSGSSYASMSGTAFYDAFSPTEAIAIKGSKDPLVQEFWFRVQQAITNGTQVNPNITSVQEGLAYASVTNQNPSSGVSIYLPGSMAAVGPWATGKAYAVGATAAVGNTVYTATTAGTSAATGSGPSGTGTGITDGTVVWSYTPSPYFAPSRIPQILAGVPQ